MSNIISILMRDNKKVIASLVLASLGLGALYLFRDEINEIIKGEKIEVGVKKKEVKKEVPKDPWSAMTWEKLKMLIGPRVKNENILEVYYVMSEEEKMSWRRAVVKNAYTPLDRSFVYLDSRILAQVYPSLNELKYQIGRYARNEASFDELYSSYKNALKEIYGIE